MSGAIRRRSGGRPTTEAAIQLEAAILERAKAAFLADGYAATTIEGIAKACGVAKRTIYARWHGKPALFRAVLEGLLGRWLASAGSFPEIEEPEAALRDLGRRILAVALTPEAVALHRLLVAESGRFPELPGLIRQAGASAGTERVMAILDRAIELGLLPPQDTAFAAEQFMHMIVAGPQRRALGLAPPFSQEQLESWIDRSAALFMRGAAC